MAKLQIKVPGSLSFVVELPSDEGSSVTIGRDMDCDVCIPSVSISSKHCSVTLRNGRYMMEDLGSTNGIVVSGQKSQAFYLMSPMEVMLGGVTLVFTDDASKTQPPRIATQPINPQEIVAPSASQKTERLTEVASAPEQDLLTPEEVPAVEVSQSAPDAARRVGLPKLKKREASVNAPPADAQKEVVLIKKQRHGTASKVLMAIYAVVVFILAMIVGMTYKHYQTTGEFLPFQWIYGVDTPLEKAKDSVH